MAPWSTLVVVTLASEVAEHASTDRLPDGLHVGERAVAPWSVFRPATIPAESQALRCLWDSHHTDAIQSLGVPRKSLMHNGMRIDPRLAQ